MTGGVQAGKVYLVLTSAGNVPRQGRVLLDGQPIPAAHAGADVKNGIVTVTGERLYSLVSFPTAQDFTFTRAAAARRQRVRLHVRLDRGPDVRRW